MNKLNLVVYSGRQLPLFQEKQEKNRLFYYMDLIVLHISIYGKYMLLSILIELQRKWMFYAVRLY